ncbi:hypothetical protein ABZ923_19515 [Streptomyces sp. NPDC046881]|uniref:hypothetical protein n=1 Tax=Streptomyces sp. NPDC046881 TaxID=3155374 RepID=UPI0033F330C0
MSDHEQTLVEISLSAADARNRAAAVRDWLLATGVIVANPTPGTLADPSEFLAGPEAEARATDDDVERALMNSGVDIVTRRQVFDSGENLEPPACRRCAAPLAQDQYVDLLLRWLHSDEPTVFCSSCEHSEPLGDWPGEWACQVGELAVCFNNWPPLREAFVCELGQRLGPRWRVVYGHH